MDRRLAAPPAPQAPAGPAAAAIAPARPATKDTLVLAKKPAAPPASNVVPGELLRTVLALTAMVLSPIVQGAQTVAMIAKATPTMSLLRGAQAMVVTGAAMVARQPLLNNAVTRGGLGLANKLYPLVGAGILAFDGYAAYQTLTNPEASAKRKWLVGARFVANAIATGLCFVPRIGAVLSMPPAWASIGLDLWIKGMNAKGQP